VIIGFLSMVLAIVPGHPHGNFSSPPMFISLISLDLLSNSKILVFTASSSYSSASLSIISIAAVGQLGKQSPNPSQYISLTSFAFPLTNSIAFS